MADVSVVTDEPVRSYTEVFSNYRVDLRDDKPDAFRTEQKILDWDQLSWKNVGRPFRVENFSNGKRVWEEQHGDTMPVSVSWQHFNQSFHKWFEKNVPEERARLHRDLLRSVRHVNFRLTRNLLMEYEQLSLWNYAHRIQDAIWDPRGKRGLFANLDLNKPRILFLGAADGYEAMQLSAMYPGGEAVLVDYDPFCKSHRFGEFPASYPFLGNDPRTGSSRAWTKDEMNLEFIVEDIRNLPFGQEFDVVISVGFIEHFPDEYKSEALLLHRKFLKENGIAILTTPRYHWRTRLFYHVMAEAMNYTYRELMTVAQMGLYVHENGFRIARHGVMKAHNGIVAKLR